jgi:hypothetical protein
MKLPRWKQWIMRHVIGDFHVFWLGQTLRTGNRRLFIRVGNPGGWNTAEDDHDVA